MMKVSKLPRDHPLMARKIELMEQLYKFVRGTGIDGRNADDNVSMLNALSEVVAMMIAAHGNDIEVTIRQITREALPSMVAYYQQSPESNFWRRKPN